MAEVMVRQRCPVCSEAIHDSTCPRRDRTAHIRRVKLAPGGGAVDLRYPERVLGVQHIGTDTWAFVVDDPADDEAFSR